MKREIEKEKRVTGGESETKKSDRMREKEFIRLK